MSKKTPSAGQIIPHYLTLNKTQLRIWHCEGTTHEAPVLAISGLIESAESLAQLISQQLPGRQIIVLELPGTGGSDVNSSGSSAIETTVEAIRLLEFEKTILLANELANGFLQGILSNLPAQPASIISVGVSHAQQWASQPQRLPELSPKQNGTQLTALWGHLRDYSILTPDLALAAPQGDPLPGPERMHKSLVAFIGSPARYSALWHEACQGIAQLPESTICIETLSELSDAITHVSATGTSVIPETTPLGEGRIWYQYVETSVGLAHLRRCGSSGEILLVLGTGGGSAAQFAPVVQGLSEGRQVVSVDYFGNGFSEKLQRPNSIELIANDMLALMHQLGAEHFNIWGSHTGSLVALEMAIIAPEAVKRLVLEGPVFIDPEFAADLQENYFIDFTPDKWGLYLQQIWNWRRDMFLFWPWYRDERSAARKLGLPSAEDLHFYALGVLESGPTYGDAYASAFRYDTASRIPHIKCETWVCAGPADMLANGVEAAASINNPALTCRFTPTTVWWPRPERSASQKTMDAYNAFLSRGQAGLNSILPE